MWDTIKVIIGLLLMTVIGIVIFIGKVLLTPINPAEVAHGQSDIQTDIKNREKWQITWQNVRKYYEEN